MGAHSSQWAENLGKIACEERLGRQDRGTNPVWLVILQIGRKEERSAIHG